VIKDKLKKAVMRYAIEHYQLSVGPKGLNKAERDKFKAELYCYMRERIKMTLINAVDQQEALNTDIREQQTVLRDEKQALVNKAFFDEQMDKYIRL
jgi:hypothetical protein